MSILFKVVGIGLVGMVIAVLLKEVKPSFVGLVTLSTCVIISVIIISICGQIIGKINAFLQKLNLSSEIIKTALKIIGVGFIIEFASDIVEENGFASISKKIILCGKIIIFGMCMPTVISLFETILELI